MSSNVENQGIREENGFIILDVADVEPVGFNARYFNNTHKEYKISRGKSKLFRRSLILIIGGMLISIISIRLLPDTLGDPFKWATPILWLPRLAALFFIILAFMRIRDMKTVKSFMLFSKEGITVEDKEYTWEQIEKAEVKYTAISDDTFDLILYTNTGVETIDITSVDEFSEDVAVVLSRYLDKYKKDINSEK